MMQLTDPIAKGTVALLRNYAFFGGFAPEHLLELVACAAPARFSCGGVIFRTGEPAAQCYFVTYGRVGLEIASQDQPPLTVQTLGPGELLGLSWFYEPNRWHFDARALTEVHTIAFDARCLQARLDANHELGYEFVKRLAGLTFERLRATRLHLVARYSEG